MPVELEEQLKHIEHRVAAEEKAEIEAKVAEQKAALRVNIIPLPRVATRPFRSELTIERHPIFVSRTFKGDHWRHSTLIHHPESGEPVEQVTLVGKVHEGDRGRGVLTDEHMAAHWKLLGIWADQNHRLAELNGQHYGEIVATAYQLTMAIAGADGAIHYKRTKSLLQDLHATPIVFKNAYTWQGCHDVEQFTMISIQRWSERKTSEGGEEGRSEVRILLSRLTTEGFLHKNVKQLLLGPIEELGGGKSGPQSSVARLLYPKLDSELSTKEEYHCRLSELGKRLGLVEKRYVSERKRQFAEAVRLLNNKLILGEAYRLRVELRDSADGKDAVLVARRASVQLGLPIS